MMNNFHRCFLITLILTLTTNKLVQSEDIKLIIPKTSMNASLEALIKSKYLAYGAYPTGHSLGITEYSIQPKTLILEIEPGNMYRLHLTVDVIANFDLWLFDFEYKYYNQVISIGGPVELVQIANG